MSTEQPTTPAARVKAMRVKGMQSDPAVIARRMARQKAVKDRHRQALELRLAGYTYLRIGEQLGFSEVAAYKAVKSQLMAICKEPAEEVRNQEIARLDKMLAGLWLAASKGDVQAVDRALKIQDRRARYLGLDAPVKQELTGKDGGPIQVQSIEEKARQTYEGLRKLGKSPEQIFDFYPGLKPRLPKDLIPENS